jgi:hypothetical protein
VSAGKVIPPHVRVALKLSDTRARAHPSASRAADERAHAVTRVVDLPSTVFSALADPGSRSRNHRRVHTVEARRKALCKHSEIQSKISPVGIESHSKVSSNRTEPPMTDPSDVNFTNAVPAQQVLFSGGK